MSKRKTPLDQLRELILLKIATCEESQKAIPENDYVRGKLGVLKTLLNETTDLKRKEAGMIVTVYQEAIDEAEIGYTVAGPYVRAGRVSNDYYEENYITQEDILYGKA